MKQACLAAVALALVPSLRAESPIFPTEVTVVSLPVFVTGRDGHPVRGLTKEDFQVFDDGRPAQILGFREVDASQPAFLPSSRLERGLAAAARRQLLLVFDLSFTSPAGLKRARDAALDLVGKHLGSDDLLAVATVSVKQGIRLVASFTSDKAQLKHAIRNVASAEQIRPLDALNLFLVNPDAAPSIPSEDLVSQGLGFDEVKALRVLYKQNDAEHYAREVQRLLHSLSVLSDALDSVSGRKHLVYLSTGFADSVLVGSEHTQAAVDGDAVSSGRLWEVQSDMHFGNAALRHQVEELVHSLAASDVVVDSVDISGLGGGTDLLVQRAQEDPISGQQSLNALASGTGGVFVRSVNDLSKALSEILEMTSHCYVLVFEAGLKGTGKYHKLKVQVKGAGQSVSARPGYLERSQAVQTPVARSLEAGEAIVKNLAGGELDIRAMAVPYRPAGDTWSLAVVLEVDGPTLLQGHRGDALPLEIYAYAFGPEGRVEDSINFTAHLDLPQVRSRLESRGVQVYSTFHLPSGEHNLRFLVRDPVKNRRGFCSVSVGLLQPSASAARLSPPLVMANPDDYVILQLPSRNVGSLEIPFRVAAEAFAPEVGARLVRGRSQKICVLAEVGASLAETRNLQIVSQLLDSTGASVGLGKVTLLKSVLDADGLRRYVLSVDPGEAAPGEYVYRVRLADPEGGASAESQQTLRVVDVPR